KATTSSAQRGRGEARIRRGVRPWHVRRGWPRNLGGPRLSSKTLRWSGEPVTRLRRTARGGRTCRRPPWAQNKRPHRGKPPARGTGAVADGGRESEGCIRARTSGNRVTPGPGRAKAARVGVIFWRDPCPTPCRCKTWHQDCGGQGEVAAR